MDRVPNCPYFTLFSFCPFLHEPPLTRFWGKDGASKYSAAYFSKFPNVITLIYSIDYYSVCICCYHHLLEMMTFLKLTLFGCRSGRMVISSSYHRRPRESPCLEGLHCEKMTGETPEVRFDKRKPRLLLLKT